MITRQQVEKKRERIRAEKAAAAPLSIGQIVQCVGVIKTAIDSFQIPLYSRGKIVYVGKFYDCYDVEFSVFNIPVTASCLSDKIEKL